MHMYLVLCMKHNNKIGMCSKISYCFTYSLQFQVGRNIVFMGYKNQILSLSYSLKYCGLCKSSTQLMQIIWFVPVESGFIGKIRLDRSQPRMRGLLNRVHPAKGVLHAIFLFAFYPNL